MPLWTPSKIFTSLRQILKLSSVNSSTQTAMASWGLLGNWWLGVASTIGGVAKGFKYGKKKDEWVKGPCKKNKTNKTNQTTTKKDKGKLQLIHQGVNTKNYNQGTVLHLCTTTAAAAATTKKRIFLIYLYARFIILHILSPTYRKNFFWKETLTLKPWEKDKNILPTVRTSYRKI